MWAVAFCLSAVLIAAVCGAVARADDTPAAPQISVPHVLFFSGADVWRNGVFAHTGALWSPEGLSQEGFVLKLLGAGGTYLYRSGALDANVMGVQALGSLMPGWRFKADKLEIAIYAGLDVQYHALTLDDRDNRLRGTHTGVRVGADLWYEPLTSVMLAINGSGSSIGPGYWTRAATGIRLLDAVWIGPEIQALGDPTYAQYRAGVHLTSFRTGTFEWSGGVGYVIDSDQRDGLYARFGVLTRY